MTIDFRDLISDSYKAMNRLLHESNGEYGSNTKFDPGSESEVIAESIILFAKNNNVRSILDYGCGKGSFKKASTSMAPKLTVTEYDPAIPGKEALPSPADLVICMDVLEHIEPECLDAVLQHIQSVSIKGAILRPSLLPAKKILPDGRNAHLILESPGWWQGKVSKYFNVIISTQHLDKSSRLTAIDFICTPKIP